MLIQGVIYWGMVLGAPFKGKFHNGWSFDLSIDEETQKKLLEAGMKKDYLKNKGDDRGTFVQFRRDAVKTDGTPGKAYQVIGPDGNEWPQTKLIGNGSVVNVIVTLNERTFRGEKFLKPSALKLQVWNHEKYENNSGFPQRETTEDEKASKENW